MKKEVENIVTSNWFKCHFASWFRLCSINTFDWKCLVYADIKAGNVFLRGGNEKDKWLVKLGDFRLCLFDFMQFTSTQVSSLQSSSNKKGICRATTVLWRAREQTQLRSRRLQVIFMLCFLFVPSRTYSFKTIFICLMANCPQILC